MNDNTPQPGDPLVDVLADALGWDWPASHGVPSAEECLQQVAQAIRDRFTVEPKAKDVESIPHGLRFPDNRYLPPEVRDNFGVVISSFGEAVKQGASGTWVSQSVGADHQDDPDGIRAVDEGDHA